MKKLLVVLLAAMMVLSVAAVSMAANVKGDFRYEMYEDETKADNSYPITDLRFTVDGAVSDSVTATGVFQLKHDNNTASIDGKTASSFDMNEYYVTYKESWGGVKAGFYEYKFTPSRALLKSGQYHVWQKVDVMAATTINLPVDGLTADFLLQPYQQKGADDGAYGVSVAYNADLFGVKVSYADFLMPDGVGPNDDENLMAIDAYYKINDTMKVFLCAVDYSGNDKTEGAAYAKYGIDGIDPVIGFSADKIAGTNLFAAVEYAINPRYEDITVGGKNIEYNEYTINIKYAFTNKTALEIEHYRTFDTSAVKEADKTIYRLRYQF